MEIIGGLSFLGQHMNSRKDKKKLDKQQELLNNDSNDDKNIYSRSMFTKANKKYYKLADDRYALSQNPDETGVIPKYYNLKKSRKNNKKEKNYELFNGDEDSNFSDDVNSQSTCCSSSRSVDMSDPTFFMNKEKKILDNRKHERKFVKKTRDNNNYSRQFDSLSFDNPGQPVSINAIPDASGMNSAVSRMENERNLALEGGFSNFGENGDMTYGIVDEEHFTHNNMKPFFKRGANELTREHQAMVNQQKMELFSGLKRDGWEHKIEKKPLFSPITNIANIYGNPAMTDFYQSRIIPGKERRNELPFQPVRVGPGLGLGSKTPGGGFVKGGGDLYRVLPKTVDDLRPKTRPKLTYEGVIIHGQKGNNGPVIGKTEKRRPEKFKENNKKDLLKSYGYIRAPKLTGEINPHTMGGVNRGLLRRVQYGPAQHQVDKVTSNEMRGKFKKAHKETFEHAEPRNLHLIEGLRGRSSTHDETFIPDPTQRGKSNDYIGPLGHGSTDKGYMFDVISNIPEMNMRNVHDRTDRTGNVTGNKVRPTTINYNDVPELTMRNIHSEPDRTGNMTGEYKQAVAFDPTDIPYLTMRDIHNKYDRSGSAVSGGMLKGKTYDPNDVPELTMRNVHDRTDRNGKAIRGEYEKGHKFDPNDVPDLTMRDIHNKTDRSGKAIRGEYEKGHKFDPNDVPDLTMRNIHDRTDRNGKAIKGNYEKGHKFDQNDVPDLTMRDIHNKTDRSGKAIRGEYEKGHKFDPNDVPDLNMRDIHNQTDRNGKAIKGNYEKGHKFDPNDVPDLTMRDIHNKTDRSGKAIRGEYEKGHKFDPNDVPDLTMRDIHNQYDRSGKAMTGNKLKGKTIDYNDVPDLTMRDIHQYNDVGPAQHNIENSYTINYADATPDVTIREMTGHTNRAGPAQHNIENSYTINYADATPDVTIRETTGHTNRAGPAQHNIENSYTINYTDATPDMTIREMTGETNHANPSKSEVSALRNRRDAYNSRTNSTREVIAKGRTPTTSNYSKGPGVVGVLNDPECGTRYVRTIPGLHDKFTEFRLREPEQLNREFAPNGMAPTTDHLLFTVPKNRNERWYVNDRINTYPNEVLENNPYINNVVHKSKIKYN